jgi:glycerol uptake facilitator-like aquaporin
VTLPQSPNPQFPLASATAWFGPLAVVAPGLMVTAIILFMVAVSDAHLNPAVSLLGYASH